MKVDLAAGRAEITTEPEGLVPGAVATAVAKAGFTAGEVEITARGRLERGEDGTLALVLDGPLSRLRLAAGELLAELAAREDLDDARLEIVGRLLPDGSRDQPPEVELSSYGPVDEP